MRTQRFLRVLTLSSFLPLLFPDPSARALEPVSSVEDAPVIGQPTPERAAMMRECRDCRVRLRDGREIRGALLDVRGDTLGIRTWKQIERSPFVAGAPVRTSVPFDRVATVICGEKDPSWDGAIFGFLVGGLPVGFMTAAVTTGLREPGYEYENSSALKAFGLGVAVGGGVGAFLGYIFDSAYEHHERRVDEDALREAWAREP